MLNAADLENGVAEGIISVDQAERLKALAAKNRGEAIKYASDDEPFRLFRGFRDFFLALGLGIFSIGLAGLLLSKEILFPLFGPSVLNSYSDAAVWLIFVVVGWLFAEWITRRLRLPLSSLVILGFIAFSAALMLRAFVQPSLQAAGLYNIQYPAMIGFFGAFLATCLFYWRFRLPFALFAIAASVVGLSLPLFEMLLGLVSVTPDIRLMSGIAGLAVFFVALSYDMRDPNRLTRFSECGLWLHILAAPLMVHAFVGGFQGAASINSVADILEIFCFVALLGFIALIIDRRALLVSSLLYFSVAIYRIVETGGTSTSSALLTTLVFVGAFMVFLGTGWTTIRNQLLKLLPDTTLKRRLPPLRA